MEDFEQRNFINDDYYNIEDRNQMPKINMSNDYYNSYMVSNNNNNSNKNNFQQGNYIPDYKAEKLVNDILNDKLN